MTNLAVSLGHYVRRAICPLLAHDWRFRDIGHDGRCTAYCRFCGKCEPAQLLLRAAPPAADAPTLATLPTSTLARPQSPGIAA